METPQKSKNGGDAASPAKTAPLSPMSTNITVETRSAGGASGGGLFGLTKTKTVVMCFVYIILIGGLAYFILGWLEIPGLNEQLDRLEGEIDTLAEQNKIYAQNIEELEETVEDLQEIEQELSEIADEFNVTVMELNETVTNLTGKLGQLDELNGDLTSIVDFLNTTAASIDTSFEQITEFLQDQITSSQVLVLGNLENTMMQKTLNWDCNLASVFGQKDWATDYNVPIPASAWMDINGYVNEKVLKELCLDEADFFQHLTDNYEEWTTNNVITAVTVYTQAALDWYFPEAGEAGLVHDDWAYAAFKCANLEKKFVYSAE